MTNYPSAASRHTPGVVGIIVAAYVSNNPVPAAGLPGLIAYVHAAVSGLSADCAAAKAASVARAAPADITGSVRPDGIVSFIDGRVYKILKRHLAANGLTPATYRARYGLPDDYPMVAADYAEQRSRLAKGIGLGRPGAMADRARIRDIAA